MQSCWENEIGLRWRVIILSAIPDIGDKVSS